MQQEVIQHVMEIPDGTKHVFLTVEKGTGTILAMTHYGPGELQQLFLKIGMVLNLNRPMLVSATAPDAGEQPTS